MQQVFRSEKNMMIMLYLKNQKSQFLKNTKLIVDSGYQGIQKNHNNVLIPTKKTKKNPLNKEQASNIID
ncbi:hypothetical protein [Spiroplasma poulsonii]|uniref:hypothetical protein n=1 Tax=Spiroplasma poulsonii TaxID=2138 RepID=UPI003A5C8530